MNRFGMGMHRETRDERRCSVAAGTWAGLTALAALVLWRRWSGAFEHPVSLGAVAVVGGLGALLSLAAYWLDQTVRPNRMTRRRRTAAGLLTLAPPVLLSFALMPGHRSESLGFLGAIFALTSMGMIALGETMPRLILLERRIRRFTSAGTNSTRRTQRAISPMRNLISASCPTRPESFSNAVQVAAHPMETPRQPAANAISAVNPQERPLGENRRGEDPDGQLAGSLSQWMRRTTTPEGQDCMEGSIVVHFPAGHKHAAAHLPFSPPFSCPPQVDCEVIGEGDVRLKVAAIHAFGVRIEARRRHSDESEQTVSIDFFITGQARSKPEAA